MVEQLSSMGLMVEQLSSMGLMVEEKRTTWWDILHPEVEEVELLGMLHAMHGIEEQSKATHLSFYRSTDGARKPSLQIGGTGPTAAAAYGSNGGTKALGSSSGDIASKYSEKLKARMLEQAAAAGVQEQFPLGRCSQLPRESRRYTSSS